jgi:hypothetical protein
MTIFESNLTPDMGFGWGDPAPIPYKSGTQYRDKWEDVAKDIPDVVDVSDAGMEDLIFHDYMNNGYRSNIIYVFSNEYIKSSGLRSLGIIPARIDASYNNDGSIEYFMLVNLATNPGSSLSCFTIGTSFENVRWMRYITRNLIVPKWLKYDARKRFRETYDAV